MKNFSIDIPVALIFFSRPDHLKVTFQKIRELRPSQLFLIQDGPRDNNKTDEKAINECQEIVEDIYWQCEVKKNYSAKNLGCGMRVFTGVSWAFEYTDRLVIIEEDCVPGDSFFTFCKAMLDRYSDDQRVSMISGMNHLNVYEETPDDYFFSEGGTIWGWATWKRVWNKIDYEFNWLEDYYARFMVSNKYGMGLINKSLTHKRNLQNGKRLSSWSTQHGMSMILQSGLILIPKYNLMSNIGIGEGGTNTSEVLEILPKEIQGLYFKKTYELLPPYKHPKYVMNDVFYFNEFNRILGNGSMILKFSRKIESKYRRVKYKIKKYVGK